METATLTSPPRPVMVQPVQKSLSLPSYARAGGEGIDHKLIFAALEQREKVRRKSKIFKEKEKSGTTRQNYFCLPLSSSNKCRETSLSSDTSCSSLEFQKPKSRSSPVKTKQEDTPHAEQNGLDANENPPPKPNSTAKIDLNNNSDEGNYVPATSPTEKELRGKDQTLRSEVSRSAVGSSDSMERTERSSKSSNDSLSRKERLVAIKARVEAERERNLCDSSSEEEDTILRITRHNSDGVIHRTVREVKAKSSRAEKRFRRKISEDSVARRAARKQHKSLYLPPSTDLDAWKPPIVRSGSSFSLQRDLDEISKDFLNMESRHKFLISQSVPKDNYFSDICSGSYRSRFVRPIVDEIEAKEQRQMLKTDKNFASIRSNRSVVSNGETKLMDLSLHSNFIFDAVKKRNSRLDNSFEVPKQCVSPVSRAPTPPPRSPKSIEFVNRVLLQHQNTTTSEFYNEACSLERKRTVFRPKISVPAQQNCFDVINRELFNSRRKTCSSFSQVEEISSDRPKTPSFQHQNKFPSQHFPPRSPDLSQRVSGISRRTKLSDIPTAKLPNTADIQGRKWEKLEVDSEKKFNSLENRTKSSESSWTKWRLLPKNNSDCNCTPNSLRDCHCNKISQQSCRTESENQDYLHAETESSSKLHCMSNKFSSRPPNRVYKSTTSLTKSSTRKTSSPEAGKRIVSGTQLLETCDSSEFCFTSRKDATENLNTAMEELESVYQSLRISNENLAEKTNRNSPSINTIDCDLSKSHVIENALNFNGLPTGYCNRDDKNKFYSPHENAHVCPLPISYKDGSSINEALCIEELFGDLTEQLDLEQKLLQETRNKKLPSSPAQKRKSEQVAQSGSSQTFESGLGDIEKKCAYVTEDNADLESLETSAISNIKQRVLAKKKHKAVRSLSANLASLMQSENKAVSRKEEIAKLTNNRTAIGSGTAKQDNSSLKSENVAAELTKHSDRDEIWQVRVSMDPGSLPEDPPLQPKTTSQLRLHSALRTPNENIVRSDKHEASQSLKPNATARDKSDVLLRENELEKLLTTLLRDVSNKPIPEKKLPSLLPKEMDENESSAIISKGEMLVMQHLDVIRNYDPS